MATKWKNAKKAKGLYYLSCIFLVLLFVAGLTFALLNLYSLNHYSNSWLESLQVKNYEDTTEFQDLVRDTVDNVLRIISFPLGEEGIAEGLYLDQDIQGHRQSNLYYEFVSGWLNREGIDHVSLSMNNDGGIGIVFADGAAWERLQRYFEANTANIEESINANTESYITADPVASEAASVGTAQGDSTDRGEASGYTDIAEPYWLSEKQLQVLQVEFEKAYGQEIKAIREQMIHESLRDYRRIKQELENEGVRYLAYNGEGVITNMTEAQTLSGRPVNMASINESIRESRVWLIYDQEMLSRQPAAPERLSYYDMILLSQINETQGKPGFSLYVSLGDEAVGAKVAAYEELRYYNKKVLPAFAFILLLFLLLLVYVTVNCGKEDEEKARRRWFDRLWTEMHLALLGLALGGGFVYLQLLEYGIHDRNSFGFYLPGLELSVSVEFFVAILAGLISCSIGLASYLALIKKMKTGQLWSTSCLGLVSYKLLDLGRSIFHGGSMERKAVLTIGVVSLISGVSLFLLPLTMLVFMILAAAWGRKFEVVKSGIRRVKEGELTYKIPLKPKDELGRLSADVNDIAAGLDTAVQNRLKNERMRTELISNVSHDLKTPLTSIVTYVDLLKKEGLSSPNGQHYLDIIDQKSQRLQKLTVDLFEAAKASSGAIQVEIGKVEMKSLVNQGLGEMEGAILESGLEIIINAADEKYYVEADGRLMWRVIENLLTNVLKYAQENTRVYIDLKKTRTQAIMVMKNISKNQLNISPDELMERFKRGDEARSTEGSGLGLAIARDLVQLQKGIFDISVDGDLFKSTIILKLYPEEGGQLSPAITAGVIEGEAVAEPADREDEGKGAENKGDAAKEARKAEGLAKAGFFGWGKRKGTAGELKAQMAKEVNNVNKEGGSREHPGEEKEI